MTTANNTINNFALKIDGDSMEPTIPNGSTIFIAVHAEPAHNKVVIVRLSKGADVICRRLIKDNGNTYLKPDNPLYPTIELAPTAEICGVAEQVSTSLI